MDLVKLEKINKTYKMGDITVNALSDINLQAKNMVNISQF